MSTGLASSDGLAASESRGPDRWHAWRYGLMAAVVVAVGGRVLGLPSWASALGAVYAASVASSAGPMRATYAAWQAGSRAWSARLQESEVARIVHDVAGGVRPAVERAIAVLERHDADAGHEARRRYDAVDAQAKRRLEAWAVPPDTDAWEAMNAGYLGGRGHAAVSGSPELVRYFAVYENTPSWLPRAVRRRVVPLLRLIDVVRLLHNDEIERRALVATLWVRAAVVAVAPLTASASLTGLVPLDGGAPPIATIAFVVALTGALLMALAAPVVARYTIGQETRRWLFAAEQSIAIAAVVAAPCWAVAVYGAGAVNWLQRRDWTLRKLWAWMVLTYVPFAISAAAQGAGTGAIAAEAAIAIAATAVMAGSYGLMAPVTATTVVGALAESLAWRIRAWGVMRDERRDLRAVIDGVEAGLRTHAARSPEAEHAEQQARAAREALARRRATWRPLPRRLGNLLAHGLARVVVPEGAVVPEGVPEPRLRAALPVFQPYGLRDLVVEGGRNARRLDALVVRIAQEAVDKGASGAIRTYVRRGPGDGVEIEISNAVPERPVAGFGTGAQWLERDRLAIPGTEIVDRGRWMSDHPDLNGEVYSVVVRLAPIVFERGL